MDTFVMSLLSFLMFLVNIILAPFDTLISSFFPDISYALKSISIFFDYICNFIPFSVSYLGLNSEILSLIVSYFVFKITLPLSVYSFKVLVQWYDKLRH